MKLIYFFRGKGGEDRSEKIILGKKWYQREAVTIPQNRV